MRICELMVDPGDFELLAVGVVGHGRGVGAERQLRDDAAVAIPQAADDGVPQGAVHQHPVQQHHDGPVAAGVGIHEASSRRPLKSHPQTPSRWAPRRFIVDAVWWRSRSVAISGGGQCPHWLSGSPRAHLGEALRGLIYAASETRVPWRRSDATCHMPRQRAHISIMLATRGNAVRRFRGWHAMSTTAPHALL